MKKEKDLGTNIPSKAFYKLLTSDWQQAQTHATEVPPSCVSTDEFPRKILTIFLHHKRLYLNQID